MMSTETKIRVFYDPLETEDWDALEHYHENIPNRRNGDGGIPEVRGFFERRKTGVRRNELPDSFYRKTTASQTKVPWQLFMGFLKVHQETLPFQCECQVLSSGEIKHHRQKNRPGDIFKVVKVVEPVTK